MRTRLKVKEIAEQKNLGLTRLSQRSEVAYNTVRRLWRDPYADVSLWTLQRLADALKVDIRELIEPVPNEQASERL
ncbi:MAG: helix-turn-helix domain-containing protein [Ktedonobacteraceae bacterium]